MCLLGDENNPGNKLRDKNLTASLMALVPNMGGASWEYFQAYGAAKTRELQRQKQVTPHAIQFHCIPLNPALWYSVRWETVPLLRTIPLFYGGLRPARKC